MATCLLFLFLCQMAILYEVFYVVNHFSFFKQKFHVNRHSEKEIETKVGSFRSLLVRQSHLQQQHERQNAESSSSSSSSSLARKASLAARLGAPVLNSFVNHSATAAAAAKKEEINAG